MKTKLLLPVATIVLFVMGHYSCKNDVVVDIPGKQEVSFSFEQKDLKSCKSKDDARYLVVTIRNSVGVNVYESKCLDLYNFNGSFISEPLLLEISYLPYQLMKFLVLDADKNVIYGTPVEGSAFANIVNDPLPISFTISKDKVTKVVPEVLSTERSRPEDFGYATFDFNIVSDINFLTCVQVYDPSASNWILTTANVLIKGNPGDVILYNNTIDAVTDTIKVKDGYSNYKISISKNGYESKDTLLTDAQLKTFANKPLIFLLQKSEAETVTDYDGNVYKTVKIGDQVWMAENLKTTKYNDNSAIAFPDTDNIAWHDNTSGAYAWYNNDTANKATYGALYNWHAVNTGKLCPTGWHVPTDTEWKTLEMYLGMSEATADVHGRRGNDEGSKLAGNASLWPNGALKSNSAFGTTGFTALPGGNRDEDGGFNAIGVRGFWWSSTQYSATYGGWFRELDYGHSNIVRSGHQKIVGFSIRCLKD